MNFVRSAGQSTEHPSGVVVISGLYWASLYASMIRIHDPAPMGRGSIAVTDFPTMELSGDAFTPTDLIVR